MPIERPLRARELSALAVPGRSLLRGDRRAPRLRHEDGGQRPPARQAQGRGAPGIAERAALASGENRTPERVRTPPVPGVTFWVSVCVSKQYEGGVSAARSGRSPCVRAAAPSASPALKPRVAAS